jgi:hypothetical protein
LTSQTSTSPGVHDLLLYSVAVAAEGVGDRLLELLPAERGGVAERSLSAEVPRPGEGIWSLLKPSIANFAATDLDSLIRIVKRKMKKIQ